MLDEMEFAMEMAEMDIANEAIGNRPFKPLRTGVPGRKNPPARKNPRQQDTFDKAWKWAGKNKGKLAVGAVAAGLVGKKIADARRNNVPDTAQYANNGFPTPGYVHPNLL